jgi:hypothetical protein
MSNPKTTKTSLATLKQEFAVMAPPTYRDIRDGYYQASDGLLSLSDALETAGMTDAYLAVQQAIKLLDSTKFGAVL